jgi:flagellar export protein FliJ
MSIVLCYQSFTARLTQAIEQQRVQCQHLGAMRERTEQLLLERERDVASTAKLIERRRAEMSRAADRRERKAEDEMAARLAARAQRSSAFHG